MIAPLARSFLVDELAPDRNCSPNTVKSYQDTIPLLLRFLAEQHAAEPTRVTVEQVNVTQLRESLRDRQERCGNTASTGNQHLASFHSLFRFIGCQEPELIEQAARVQAIPVRKVPIPVMAYLDKAEIEALLASPDHCEPQGRRDYAMLLFLYNSGDRASESAGTSVCDLRLATAPSVRIKCKGRKQRVCPLWKRTAKTLRDLLGRRLDGLASAPVFLNWRGRRIGRHGILKLVKRSVANALPVAPSLRDKRVSPHAFRHTTPVHPLQSGVDINTIRAWFDQVSLEITNRYAGVDFAMRAQTLSTCADNVPVLTEHRSKLAPGLRTHAISEFPVRARTGHESIPAQLSQ